MADERASVRKPAGAGRRPGPVLRPGPDAAAGRAPPAARTLQQRLGNRGTQALAAQVAGRAAPPAAAPAAAAPIQASVQASLAISQPGDPYEQEADRVADAVMRMPAAPAQAGGMSALSAAAPAVQRACAACQAESEPKRSCASEPEAGRQAGVHRKETPGAAPAVTPAVDANVHILRGEGSPLPQATRDFFEPRFGADFGQVRVNTGTRADTTARSLGARAFTVGSSISFAAGQFAPTSKEGRQLLAHELTHVVQQGGAVRQPRALAQRQEPGPGKPAPVPAMPAIGRSTGAARVQPAWYNIDIPFTDYQFDPSLTGIKTAAGVVKDVAVEGLQWIADQIEGLVNDALAWLREQWASIKNMVHSAWNAAKAAFKDLVGFFKNPLGFLADAIMRLDADALARGWAAFSGLVTSVANGFKATADKIFGAASTVWKTIDRYANWALGKVASLTSNFLFKKLPAFVQKGLSLLVGTLKALWKEISDGWTALVKEVKSWVDSALDAVFAFVRRVLDFGINVVISGVVLFAQIVLFLKDLFTNPRKYVDLLAERTVQAFDGVESRFAGMVGLHLGGTKVAAAPATASVKGPAAITTVARAPAPSAEKKGSASWAEIGSGVLEMMGKKWAAFKANPMAVVITLLKDMIFPLAGNIEDIVKLFKDIGRIVTGPLSAGSLEELWTSLLLILDIPILIYHTVVGILMRTLTLPLIVASFIPHPVVKGIAAAVGYGLLGAFVQAELLNIGHKLLLLKTGATTGEQKKEAYNRIADSLIAFAMALAIALLMLLLHFLANVAKGIYNFVKGKVFGIEPAPAPAKGAEGKGTPAEAKESKPKTDEPAVKDLGTQNGKKVLAEKATADGKHEVKVTEEGIRCCSDLCEIMIKDIDAHVADNPALKQKLDPLRKKLETAQGKLESARILQDRAPPEKAAQAAQEVDAAAKAAAEVGAELKPQIDKAVLETPLPSGLRFNEYRTPEHALGMKEGKATPAGSDPVTNPSSIKEGYVRREYYRDAQGKKWSLDVRMVDGKPAYRLVHESSGQ